MIYGGNARLHRDAEKSRMIMTGKLMLEGLDFALPIPNRMSKASRGKPALHYHETLANQTVVRGVLKPSWDNDTMQLDQVGDVTVIYIIRHEPDIHGLASIFYQCHRNHHGSTVSRERRINHSVALHAG